MNIPRCEHPNPQWERKNWRCLNGEWEFDFDFGKSARDKKLFSGGSLSKKITVPFCPESILSGIGYTDFIPSVCYRKSFELSGEELSERIFLHFGAVDYHSFVYLNGQFVGEHIGGYSSFKFDITRFAKDGENILFVIAEDDTRDMTQPSGKQCLEYHSSGCSYTRTTGIWQTVWLEFAPREYVKSAKYYPDIQRGILTVTGETTCAGEVKLSASYEGKDMGNACVTVGATKTFIAQIKLSELHLWEVGCGRLYDLEISFGKDTVKSYFGMREVALDGYKFKINGRPLFMRTVLDQGFYPDGIYTARDDETLKNDILLSKAFGFNGARLHQKVFEKRFIYHCDKEGYIIWGEHANWGIDHANMVAQGNFIGEWIEIIERDFNSPAIIGWCPFNETWGYKERYSQSRLIENVYDLTKLYDNTRPCICASGNYHIAKKDIHDVHDYEQDPKRFAELYTAENIENGIVNDQIRRSEGDVQPYTFGEPIFVSEYGGTRWAPDAEGGWGYGDGPKEVEEFADRYCRLTDTLISNPYITGLCYTQLYDVEQEVNGIYCYDRTPKFDGEIAERMKAAMTKVAAIES